MSLVLLKSRGGSPQGSLFGTAVTRTVAIGALTLTLALSGAAVTRSTATGALNETESLSGVAVTRTVATGAMTGAGALSGTAVSRSTAIGALTGTGALSGTAVAGTYAVGDLGGIGTLSGVAAMVSPSMGDLQGIAVAVAIAPEVAGGLLPGWLGEKEQLGTGMGPYKRSGQVFGEPDPISPRLTSRAEVAERYASKPPVLTQVLPQIELAPLPLLAEDEAIFALVAFEELTGSDPLRGPITLHIVRRKV